MTVHHNDPEQFIYDTEDFCKYHSLLISEYKGNILQTNTTQFITAQLDGGSNSHVFTDIKNFTYIISVNCNVEILNISKAPEKGFVLVIVKITKSNIIIPLWPSYYMPSKITK